MAKYEQLAYAIWSWGLERKEQMITGMKDVKEAGFNYFESVCTAIDLFQDDLKGFQAACAETQVYPVSFYFWGRGDFDVDVNAVEKALDFLAANDIKRITIQAAGKPGGHATEGELKLALRTLIRIGEITKPYGIIPSMHNHTNTVVMFEPEIDFMMQNTDPELIGFCPDTAHLTAGDCDAVEMVRRYANRVKFTHIKDVKKNKPVSVDESEHQEFEIYSDFLELGTGDVDLPGVIDVLDSVGYDGYLTVELDRAPISQRESAFNNMAYMKKLLK